MKQTTRIAIASLLHSAGKVLSALAFEFGGTEAAGDPETPATPEAPKTRKPREAKKEDAPKPEEPVAETKNSQAATNLVQAIAEDQEAEAAIGKTYEELRALIEPLVKGGQGPEVKKLIAKYDPSDTPSIKTMPARNHAAFEKDLAALGY